MSHRGESRELHQKKNWRFGTKRMANNCKERRDVNCMKRAFGPFFGHVFVPGFQVSFVTDFDCKTRTSLPSNHQPLHNLKNNQPYQYKSFLSVELHGWDQQGVWEGTLG